ncbi:Uncharacterized protein MLTONO_p0435 (plasmid) [Mesorhizobium loti]|nr:Uncharacterized protein MLTONO_p0435 [Mesorhizobium loti]
MIVFNDLKHDLLEPSGGILMAPTTFAATLEAHGLYSTKQFVLRLSPRVHELVDALASGDFGSHDPADLIQAYSTYIHETIHWWQHVGSTAGLIFSLCYPAQFSSSLENLQKAIAEIGPKKSLKRWADDALRHGTAPSPEALAEANIAVNNALDIEFYKFFAHSPNRSSELRQNQHFENVGHSYRIAHGNTLMALLPLHNIYADYRNHPTFFRKMERFTKAVLDYRVRFDQPRLWSTKGQTLRAFLGIVGKSEQHLTNTHSCWQTRRIVNVGGRKQCGLCAACLLRRLSLHAAGVNEASGTYVVSNLAASHASNALSVIPQKADRDIMVEYGSVGARHLQHLAEMADLPDDALRVHASQIAAATEATYEETLTKLRTMLVTHAAEWRVFLSAQGDQGFLKSWMDGGRYGRSE